MEGVKGQARHGDSRAKRRGGHDATERSDGETTAVGIVAVQFFLGRAVLTAEADRLNLRGMSQHARRCGMATIVGS